MRWSVSCFYTHCHFSFQLLAGPTSFIVNTPATTKESAFKRNKLVRFSWRKIYALCGVCRHPPPPLSFCNSSKWNGCLCMFRTMKDRIGMPTILLGISITTKYADIIWCCEFRIAFSFKSFTDMRHPLLWWWTFISSISNQWRETFREKN